MNTRNLIYIARSVVSAVFRGSVAYYSSCRSRKVMIQVTNVGNMFYEGIFYTSVKVVGLESIWVACFSTKTLGLPDSHSWRGSKGFGRCLD